MRKTKLWKKLLAVEHAVLEDADAGEAPDGSEIAVVRLHPDRGHRLRCPGCGRKCRFYDAGEGRRRWRALDLGVMRCFLEADAPRVKCPRHGVLTAAVPWAGPGARFTTAFEDHAAWLCAQMPWSKAARLLRTTWRSLQSIVERVVAGLRGGKDRLDGVRRIGIDEKAWRKGHRYITVVVDHDAGRIIWAAEGRNKETLAKFFDDLGEERAGLLTEAGTDPRLIPFTAVLGLVRGARRLRAFLPGTADTARPAEIIRLSGLANAIVALPRHRQGRQRPPGEPQPNAGPGTPKKSLTPSTSQSRISRNGTHPGNLRAVLRACLARVLLGVGHRSDGSGLLTKVEETTSCCVA